MFLLNDSPLPLDRPFSHNGINYPANWLRLATSQQKAAIGITEVADEPETPYDQRFYWGPNNPKLLNDREESDEDGNPLYVKVLGQDENGEPVMIDSEVRLVTKGLKSQWTAQVKDTAGKMLAQTDWMVTRKFERDIDIPTATVTFRAAVVTECDRLETAIAACENVEELIGVVTTQNWPKES
jgi:hypothetical protein